MKTRIYFSNNYEKLHWPIFTTIRKVSQYYLLGNEYEICLGHWRKPTEARRMGDAIIIAIMPLDVQLHKITQGLALVDCDKERGWLIKQLSQWYKNDEPLAAYTLAYSDRMDLK